MIHERNGYDSKPMVFGTDDENHHYPGKDDKNHIWLLMRF
jgi:hypothetical protein